jgi:hypothetical protein
MVSTRSCDAIGPTPLPFQQVRSMQMTQKSEYANDKEQATRCRREALRRRNFLGPRRPVAMRCRNPGGRDVPGHNQPFLIQFRGAPSSALDFSILQQHARLRLTDCGDELPTLA